MRYWLRAFSTSANTRCGRPRSLWLNTISRGGYERGMFKQGELVGGRPGACHRAGRGDGAGTDGRVYGSRCLEAYMAKRRGSVLVAFAQKTVAQGRGVGTYSECKGKDR